jgi:hypothetical protein
MVSPFMPQVVTEADGMAQESLSSASSRSASPPPPLNTFLGRRTNRALDEESDDSSCKKPTEGSECATQTLYEGPPKCNCCKNWVEEYPDDLRMQVEEQADDGKALVLDSVVVQSLSLKKTLGEVFEGYKGITASLKKLVFQVSFPPVFLSMAGFHRDTGAPKGSTTKLQQRTLSYCTISSARNCVRFRPKFKICGTMGL